MSPDREVYWRKKLRRLRLGAEPIADQLAGQFRATVALTGVAVGVAMMFVAIFASFDRPDVGAIVTSVLMVPVVAFAWLDFSVMKIRAARYSGEIAAEWASGTPPG